MTDTLDLSAALRCQRVPAWSSSNDLSTKPRLSEIRDFGVNPGALRMMLYVPENLAAHAPLVVILHGSWQTARDYAEGAGWLTLADRFGFAVLCPEQTWGNNGSLSFNWFEPADSSRDGGEAASISQMVRYAIDEHDLDAKRVFITGLSAGGAMTAVMLATYPEMFAAGAVIAGMPYGVATNIWEALAAMSLGRRQTGDVWGDKVRAASANLGPWPRVSIWHGAHDATIRPCAGDDLVSQWRNVHGLLGDSVEATTDDGRLYRVWHSASGEGMVEQHTIAGMDHGAPLKAGGSDGYGLAGPYLLEVGISSSLEIAMSWVKLERHALPVPADIALALVDAEQLTVCAAA